MSTRIDKIRSLIRERSDLLDKLDHGIDERAAADVDRFDNHNATELLWLVSGALVEIADSLRESR